jgi:hypothetical protein
VGNLARAARLRTSQWLEVLEIMRVCVANRAAYGIFCSVAFATFFENIQEPHMNIHTRILLASLSVAAAGSMAMATTYSATITADNHYAVYTGRALNLTLVGHNELGSGGNPGTYNWSQPENWNFSTTGDVFIAVWSDDSVAQGLLADIRLAGQNSILDVDWEVYKTGIDRDDNAPVPTLSEMGLHILAANIGNLWRDPYVGGVNGVAPWGHIAGISNNTHWLWANIAGVTDPTQGGRETGEMLIFRMNVPTPAAAALFGAGAIFAGRRRR